MILKFYRQSISKLTTYDSELNQVWTNLIDNAIDAMNGKGELTLQTAQSEDSILVNVIDTGAGIAPEVRSRIFEPFFTTKGIGTGTRLGLEIFRRIIVQQHGNIWFDSRPGQTRFQVRLPIALSTTGETTE